MLCSYQTKLHQIYLLSPARSGRGRSCNHLYVRVCEQNISRTEPDIITKLYRGLFWYKRTNPIDFEKFAIQDGRTMAAILKNTKTAVTSLIMLRFSPFFFDNIQNFKGYNIQSWNLQNLPNSREQTRSCEITNLAFVEKHKNVDNFLNICPSDSIFFHFA